MSKQTFFWAGRAACALGSLLLLVSAGCGHKTASGDTQSDKKDAALPVVQVVPVTRGVLERTLPATGTLMALPGQEASLSPPVTGVIDSLSAHSGEAVRKGQVLAQLSTRQLQGPLQQAQATLGQNLVQVQQAQANALQQQAQTRTAILQAQAGVNSAQATLAGAEATLTGNDATLRNAEQNLTRAQTLYVDGLIPQKDVETAELAVRTAQAQVGAQKQAVDAQRQTVVGQRQIVAAARAASLQDIIKRKDVQVAQQQVRNAQGALRTAQAQFALYTLRAPLSGQITAVGANIGETVDTTAKVVTIANLDRLQIQIAIPTASESQVHPGQRVTFMVNGWPGEKLKTTVARVGSQVDAATGTVPAYAVIANPGHRLKDDTTVQAHILTERRVNVLTVPQAAVLTDPDTGKPSVMVVGPDEVGHVTPVTLGLSANGQVEIQSGVTEGQKVVVSGQYGLPDGTKVTAQNAPGHTAPEQTPSTDLSAPGTPGKTTPSSGPVTGGASAPVPAPTSSSPAQSAPGVSAPATSSGILNAPHASTGPTAGPNGNAATGAAGSGSGGASHGP